MVACEHIVTFTTRDIMAELSGAFGHKVSQVVLKGKCNNCGAPVMIVVVQG